MPRSKYKHAGYTWGAPQLGGPFGGTLETMTRPEERDLITSAFEQAGRNHTQAARLLGVHPNYLHRLVRNLDLRPRIGAR